MFEPLIRETQPYAKKIAHRSNRRCLLRPKSADGKPRHPPVRSVCGLKALQRLCLTRQLLHLHGSPIMPDRDAFRKPSRCRNKWDSSYPWVLGCAFVESLLQLFLRLMIEFLVPALGLTGLLPKLIRAADNINLSGLAHWLLSRRLRRTRSANWGRGRM